MDKFIEKGEQYLLDLAGGQWRNMLPDITGFLGLA